MIVLTQKSFDKDIEKISDKKLAVKFLSIINTLETVSSVSEINHLKKMKSKGNYYRIRIGNYRLGFKLEKGVITLLRFMHRKEIYDYFP